MTISPASPGRHADPSARTMRTWHRSSCRWNPVPCSQKYPILNASTEQYRDITDAPSSRSIHVLRPAGSVSPTYITTFGL